MTGVLHGFLVIALVIGLGYATARRGVLDANAQYALGKVVFYLATPALLFTTLMGADVGASMGRSFLVALLSALGASVLYGLWARARSARRKAPLERGHTVIGALAASYANGANLGVPITVYVLGDARAIAPLLLLQLLVMAPAAFMVLDRLRHTGVTPMQTVLMPVRNPVVLASLLGLLFAVTDLRLPVPAQEAVTLLSGFAVPGALLAYGISLHTEGRALDRDNRVEALTISAIKLIAMPLMAWAIGGGVFGMRGHELLGAVVLAALPTAQTVFVYAMRYERGVALSRDVIFTTTLGSAPVLVLIALLLG